VSLVGNARSALIIQPLDHTIYIPKLRYDGNDNHIKSKYKQPLLSHNYSINKINKINNIYATNIFLIVTRMPIRMTLMSPQDPIATRRPTLKIACTDGTCPETALWSSSWEHSPCSRFSSFSWCSSAGLVHSYNKRSVNSLGTAMKLLCTVLLEKCNDN
jgi:hypothetical protein